MPSDPATLLSRLLAEGRRVYRDEADRTILRVSGQVPPALGAEIAASKPALLALLEADALAEEVAKRPSPFAEEAPNGACLLAAYSCWRVPRWVSDTGWLIFAGSDS